MSNNIKDTLHELIMHMSKSEKRYFKVFSSRHTIGEENNYIKLFDFIESLKEYDEKLVFSKFKNETFLNKFSITKKRLYDNIINALDNYHSSNSVDAQLYKLLNSSEILYQKSLYNQSLKQLRSAEKIALKHNKFNLLLEINLKKKKTLESIGNIDKKEIDLILQQDEEFHIKSLTFDKFWNLKSKLFHLLSSKGISRSQEDILKFKEIIDELLISSKKSELYFETQYLYNHIYSAYYFAINSFEECNFYLKENVKLLEENSEFINQNSNKYLSVLTNSVYVSMRLNLKEDIIVLQNKLKALLQNNSLIANEDLQIKLFSSIYSLELTILSLQGKFKEAIEMIPIIESGLIIHAEKITESRKHYFYFKIATIFFSTSDYHNALKYLNKLLNESSIDLQEDIISFSHILGLLIHVEMKNENFIPYVLRSTQRYLKTRNRMYEFEDYFLKTINKLCKAKNDFDKEIIWSELYNYLVKSEDSNLKRIVFEYFDFISWAKSKAERKNFQNLIQCN